MTSQSARTDKDEEQWTFLDAAGQRATFLNVCGKQLGVTCLLNLNVHMFCVPVLMPLGAYPRKRVGMYV